MKTKRWLLVSLLLATTIATASCAGLGVGGPGAEDTFKVAYVYVGPVGDLG